MVRRLLQVVPAVAAILVITFGVIHLAPGDPASFGNVSRNSLRGPGINNWDISFLKKTKISESKSVEFRGELFNAFNHAQFLNPDPFGFDSTFGQVSQTRGPRLVQFALKFYF